MERALGGPSPALASVPNLRDVGGRRTHDGARVRTGLLYRSSALHGLDPTGGSILLDLGIRTVYDLRTAHERTADPDRLAPSVEYVAADVIGEGAVGGPAELMAMLSSPEAARAGLGDGRGVELWRRHYRQFVSLDSARAAYGRLFADLADGDRGPVLVHCTTGKDRTGWAAAALLLLLGVSHGEVMDDYLLSNDLLRPLVEPILAGFAARGSDPELLRPILTVRPAYLEAALDEAHASFGSIEDYFAAGLGIDSAGQARLRRAFRVPA